MLLVSGMEVACVQHNMRHYGKHEILLLYLYLNPDWVVKYLGSYHNNATQI